MYHWKVALSTGALRRCTTAKMHHCGALRRCTTGMWLCPLEHCEDVPLRRCSTAKMYHCGASGASVHNAPVLHGLAESREDDVMTPSFFDSGIM